MKAQHVDTLTDTEGAIAYLIQICDYVGNYMDDLNDTEFAYWSSQVDYIESMLEDRIGSQALEFAVNETRLELVSW